jgi:hypothetical protein
MKRVKSKKPEKQVLELRARYMDEILTPYSEMTIIHLKLGGKGHSGYKIMNISAFFTVAINKNIVRKINSD